MIGQRQNLAAASIAPGASYTFTVDRAFPIHRIKFTPSDGGGLANTDTVMLTAEGEGLFGNQAVPVIALALRTDDATTSTTSPYVLAFDRPLILSKDYPLTIKVGGAKTFWCVLEGA